MVTSEAPTMTPGPAQVRSWVRRALVVTTCPQVVIGVTPALTLLLAGAGQSEEGWQLAGSSFPPATFVPMGGVAKFCTRMPSPEPSELPPRNPLPPAWLPFRVAAL